MSRRPIFRGARWGMLTLCCLLAAGCEEPGDGIGTGTPRDPDHNETPTGPATPTAGGSASPSPTAPAPTPTPSQAPTPEDGAPRVTILSPAEGQSFEEGQVALLRGEAVDPQDGPLSGPSLKWTSSLDGLLGTGAELGVTTLSVGAHRLTLTAVDSGGQLGADHVTVSVVEVGADEPPQVSISSPEPGASFTTLDTVALEGAALDPEDGPLDGERLAWSSDLDGALGAGASLSVQLSAGAHLLSLTATDSFGNTGAASVEVAVSAPQDAPPAVRILSPEDLAVFTEGQAVALEGEATDPEDGPLAGEALQWSSSLDGPLGAGAAVLAEGLSAGRHAIRLVATDSAGQSAAASITVDVDPLPVDEPPTARILAPVNGASVAAGEAVILRGEAADPEDGPLTGAALTWTSSLDGLLGTGEALTAGGLAEGAHRITLTALDSQAQAGSASITLTVTPAGVENRPPVARLSGPTVVTPGQLAAFDGSASSDPDGAVVRWVFELGDGASQDGASPRVVHAFGGQGPWTVRLTVYDDDGASASAELEVRASARGSIPQVVADTRARLGSFCALAFSEDGAPFVAYSDADHGGLILAEAGEGGWRSALVEGFGLGVGGEVSPGMDLAVDAEGRPHLAWLRAEGAAGWAVRYGVREGGAWRLTTVAAGESVSGARPVALALDGGAPAILYRDADGRGISLASCAADCQDAGAWQRQSLLRGAAGDASPGDLVFSDAGAFAVASLTSAPAGASGLYVLRRGEGGAWAAEGPLPAVTPPASGALPARLTAATAPLIAVAGGVLSQEAGGWGLSPVEPGALSYFDLIWDPQRSSLFLTSRLDGVLELVETEGQGFFLYDAIGTQDAAWPMLALDDAGDPRICFARDGNVLIY